MGERHRERERERERERILNISLITRKNNSVFIYVIIRFILFYLLNYSFFFIIIIIIFLHYSLRNLLRLIFFCQSWGQKINKNKNPRTS